MVLVFGSYESGPESGPEEAGLVAGVGGQLFDGLVRSMGEHRQVREVVQAETAGAAPAVVGAVQAREGDGEEGPAIGLVLPYGSLARSPAGQWNRDLIARRRGLPSATATS